MKPTNFEELFPKITTKTLCEVAERVSKLSLTHFQWRKDSPIYEVFTLCSKYPNLLPALRSKISSVDDYVSKWMAAYENGFSNRASKRIGKPVGTVADPMVSNIIAAAAKLPSEEISKIENYHRLSMAAENMLGNLLEEYLATKLEPLGWFCCWGNTVLHVDFCSNAGDFLQVKNRSNSENSSSNKVRVGTDILHWYRVNAGTGETEWERLCQITKCKQLSESDFEKFIRQKIAENPKLLSL